MGVQLFAAAADGSVQTNWWAGSWQSWQGLATTPPGVQLLPSPISLVSSRDGRTQFGNIDVFVAGSDGQVYTAWWRPIQSWTGWRPVATPPAVRLTSDLSGIVTSIDRTSGFGNLDIFAVGEDGNVYTAWFRPAQGWRGWLPVATTPAGVRLEGVSAITSSLDPATGFGNIDVFAVGSDGVVYTAWWRPSQGWQGWRPVATLPAGVRLLRGISTLVSSLDRDSGFGNLDLFAAGDDGRVYTAWFRLRQGWQGWLPVATLPSGLSLRPGIKALVSSLDEDTGFGNLDVFAVDTAGLVHTAWWRPRQGWHGWLPVATTPPGGVQLTPGLNAAVISREQMGVEAVAAGTLPRGGFGSLDVYAVGSDDRVYTAWWRPGQGWQGWLPVGTLPAGVQLRSAISLVVTRILRVRLHIKILQNPIRFTLSTMIQDMNQVFLSANIVVELASTETLNLPALLDVQVAPCLRGQTPTAQQTALFSNRNNVLAGDIVVYFVRSTRPPSNGCAASPPGQPGAVVAQVASRVTMAHEIGHVLGLPHCDDGGPCLFDRLMTGCGTNNITNLPPDLISSEIVSLNDSPLTFTF